MNIVFDYNKNMNEYSEFLESEYKLEYLNIDNEALEAQSNASNQLNDFKSPSLDLPSVFGEQMLDSKFKASKNQDQDDMLLPYSLKSTTLIDDSSSNIIKIKKAESSHKLDFSRVDRTIDKVKEEYSEKLDIEIIGVKKSAKVQELGLSHKTLCLQKSKSDVDSEQNQHHMTESTAINQNSGNTSYRRWGRNEDIQMFNTLREL